MMSYNLGMIPPPAADSPAPVVWEGGSPDDYVGWTLIQASHALGRHFEALLGTLGLTPMQFGVLVQLSLQPDLASAELARIVLVTPQSMGELLSSLERAGLVERDRNAGPGRRITARVTDAGRAALREATPIVQALNVPDSLGISTEERALLNRLLHKVRAAVVDPGFRDRVEARLGRAHPS
nr:putative transcriptional regulatory protein [uncultured bacterium]